MAKPRDSVVAHIRELLAIQGEEAYVAKRLPYVVDKVAAAAGLQVTDHEGQCDVTGKACDCPRGHCRVRVTICELCGDDAPPGRGVCDRCRARL